METTTDINIKTEYGLKAVGKNILRDMRVNKNIYIMLIPVIAYYLIFCYAPMYGAIIAFKDFSISKGILGSPWTENYGLKHFIAIATGPYFWRLLRNTFLISLYDIVFAFPAPIIFALLLNEIKNSAFKRTIQTITYLPHFISTMVICGMIVNFVGRDGMINNIIILFGGERSNLLAKAEMFRTIFVASNIWQGVGWGSIVFLSALSAIDTQLYEAAVIDGAGRFKQMWYITLPGIMPTIVILFILRMGSLLSVGFEKIILLYNPATYETADVISSFVYRKGLEEMDYSYSTAVGLINSLVNFIMLYMTNYISRKLSDTSLW